MKLGDLVLEMDKSETFPILVEDVARFLEKKGVCDDIEFVKSDIDQEKVKGFIRGFEYMAGPNVLLEFTIRAA